MHDSINRIYFPSNRSKQIQATLMVYIAVCEAMYVVFMQTLPRALYASAIKAVWISWVFLDRQVGQHYVITSLMYNVILKLELYS